jgi:hypothetical protein
MDAKPLQGCGPDCRAAEQGYPAPCEMYQDDHNAGCPRQSKAECCGALTLHAYDCNRVARSSSGERFGEDEPLQIWRTVEGQELAWKDCAGAVPVEVERRDEWAREMMEAPEIRMTRTGDSAVICVIGEMNDAALYDVLVRRVAHFKVERIEDANRG